jgi:uncharacterized protein
MPDLGTLIGRGIAFPPRLGADGRLLLSAGAANVREATQIILLTELRERVMRPDFGAGLRQYLMEPNVGATHALLVETTRRALQNWEPRIRLDRVEAAPDAGDPQAAILTIAYRLVATAEPGTLTLAVPLAG